MCVHTGELLCPGRLFCPDQDTFQLIIMAVARIVRGGALLRESFATEELRSVALISSRPLWMAEALSLRAAAGLRWILLVEVSVISRIKPNSSIKLMSALCGCSAMGLQEWFRGKRSESKVRVGRLGVKHQLCI